MNSPRFHAFTTKFSQRTDRIITEVSLCEAFDPRKPPKDIPQSVRMPALWDTGATKSVITPSAVKKLGLKPVGTAVMNAAGGARQCSTYMVNITLPNSVRVVGAHVLECEDHHSFEAIIGMDIITAGDFAITNVNGQTTVTFRIPSMQTIDYVKEHDAPTASTAGRDRNKPCHCGSGKKLKHCHGKGK